MAASLSASRLLIDQSAWSRLQQSALPSGRAEAVFTQMEARELVVCLPFLLEAGYSARDGDYDVIRDRTDLDFESVWLAQRGTL